MGKLNRFQNQQGGKNSGKNTAYKTERKEYFKEDELEIKDYLYELKKPKSEVIWNDGSPIQWMRAWNNIENQFKMAGLSSQLDGTDNVNMPLPDRTVIVDDAYNTDVQRNTTLRNDAIDDLNQIYGFAGAPGVIFQGPFAAPNPQQQGPSQEQAYRSSVSIITNMHIAGAHAATDNRRNHERYYDSQMKIYHEEQEKLRARRKEAAELFQKLLGDSVYPIVIDLLGNYDFVGVVNILNTTYGGGTSASIRDANLHNYLANIFTYDQSKVTFDGFCTDFNNAIRNLDPTPVPSLMELYNNSNAISAAMQQNAVINAAHVAAVAAAAATNPPGPAPAPPNLVPIPAPLPTPKISNDVRKMWFRNAVQRGYEGLDFVFQNAELQPNMHIDDLMSTCRNIMIRNRQKNKLIKEF